VDPHHLVGAIAFIPGRLRSSDPFGDDPLAAL